MLRRIFTFVPLILLLGSALLLFFINLSGAKDTGVLSRFYWSEVQSSDFGSSGDKSRWTLYSLCGVKDGKNIDCTKNKPAYPYSPADNFKSTSKLPKEFSKHRDTYYYLSRFAYAFFLIGIVFAIIALIPTIFSCFTSGTVTGLLSSVASGLALLFTAAGAAFITAVHVKGRNAFRNAGYSSSLSVKTFGVLWAAVACLLISFIWMCVVSGRGTAKKLQKRRAQDEHESYAENKVTSSDSSHRNSVLYNDTQNNNYAGNAEYPGTYEEQQAPASKRFFFRRS